MPKLPSFPAGTHFEYESIDVASSWNIGTEPNLSFVPIITRCILEEDGIVCLHAKSMACRPRSKRLTGFTEPEQMLHLFRPEPLLADPAFRAEHEFDERSPTGKGCIPENCSRFIDGNEYAIV